MKEFSRTDRIADFLKRELGSLIQLQIRDPRVGMVSVTDAEVSRDLSHAKVYVTVMGKDSAEEAKESLAVLNKAAGFLRSKVAKSNNARTTPQLRFYYDSSIDRGQRLSKLIQDAVESDRSRQQDDE
ncbi:ribosome-binding factor A [Spongiibacter sp. IMCC21906]|uniref:30S ribosome-binding factor RbfA n=1 Tax=Spongiibacter sp. IMCC21906 TaxID=1620392 RepID=UPI00062DED3E|nr:30S ribosome-binding factor RbfA [Spongiibacter sp. IMCC21906]AKH70759.1 ribosome-binding factor A [Spongiibacter sp. IMCC21906]